MAVGADTARAPVGAGSGRSAQRRAELLDAAIRVIRREGDEVAMEGIAAEAGISRPILYRHFGDATGLYAAVARHFGDELMARLRRGPDEAPSGRALLHRQVATFLAFVAEEPNLYRFLVRQRPGPARRGFSRQVAGVTADFLVDAGWERPLAVVASDVLVGGLEATADRWLDDPLGSPEEVAELVTTIAWAGYREAGRSAGGGSADAGGPAGPGGDR